ncbi:hypothetical protein CBL_06733 [Carabus blaptoides fortunei]
MRAGYSSGYWLKGENMDFIVLESVVASLTASILNSRRWFDEIGPSGIPSASTDKEMCELSHVNTVAAYVCELVHIEAWDLASERQGVDPTQMPLAVNVYGTGIQRDTEAIR